MKEQSVNGTPDPGAVEDALGSDQLESLFTTDEEKAVAAKVIPIITQMAIAKAEAKKAKELEELIEGIRKENKRLMEEKFEEYRKAMTPPSPDELEKLLNQEYVEFPVKLRRNGSEKVFTIRELPLKSETKIIKVIQRTLGSQLKDLSKIEWAPGTTQLDRIEKIVAVVPGALETLAECCAVCLDPYGDADITGEWIQNNLGVSRLTAIIHAQLQVGRYRDFLSLAGRFFPNQTMI